MTSRNKAFGRNRGNWAASTFYLRGDVVSYQGALYEALSTFTSTTTFNPANWDLVLAAPVISTPSASTLGACQSTVGAALPLFSNRNVGDLHLIPPTTQYELTGAAVGVLNDPFSGADGALTTAPTGQAYSTVFNTASRLGGKVAFDVVAVGNGAGYGAVASIGTGAQEVSADVVFPASGVSDEVHLMVRCDNTGANGYDLSLENGRIKIGKGGPVGSALLATINSGQRSVSGRYTLTVDGSVTAPTIRAYLNGTLLGSYTDGSSPNNNAYAGFYGKSTVSNTCTLDNLYALTPGTLAWTATAPAVPTLAALGAAKSTVGAGLPSFAGRNQGDLHYDSVAGKECVLTGVPGGTSITDGFTRANAASLGTSDSGATWVTPTGTGPAINSHQAVFGDASTALVNIGVPDQSATLDVVFPTGGAITRTDITLCSDAGRTSYYSVVVSNSGSNGVEIDISKNGSFVGSSATGATIVRDRLYKFSAAVKAGIITATVIDTITGAVVTNTYTDPSPLSNNYAGFAVYNGTVVDNFAAVGSGTLAWTPTVALPAAPTLAALGGSKTTDGPGLPPFTGRVKDDLHYNSTTAKLNILTGAAGGTVSDDFNRADGALGSTPVGNKAWTLYNNPVVAGQKMAMGGGNNSVGAFVNSGFGAGAKTVGATFTMGVDNSVNLVMGPVALASENTNDCVFISIGVGSTNLICRKYAGGTAVVNQGVAIPGATGATAAAGTQHTLAFHTDPVAGTIDYFFDGVLIYTATDPAPATTDGWSYGGINLLDNGFAAKADDFSMLSTGTLAWTPTVNIPATPTLASLGGSKITQGAGLPSFAGRVDNDLHYDTNTGKTSILTGVAGGSVTDNFNRADGALGTASDGTVWDATAGQLTTIVGNRARLATSGGGPAYQYFNCGAGDQTVSGTLTNYAATLMIQSGSKTGSPDSSGYSVYLDTNGITLNRAGTQIGSFAYAGTGKTNASSWAISLSSSNGVITVIVDGTTRITYTDATPLSGAWAGFGNWMSNNTTYADDISIQSNGSLAWSFSEPIYVQAQLVSGAVAVANHVLKPGIRVPTDCTLREMILRIDSTPTGSGVTVQCERFNNGVSQGVIATATIAASAQVGSVSGLSAGCAKGDILHFNVTAIGSTLPGSDLSASLDFH